MNDIENTIDKLARHLPVGYEVQLCVERNAAWLQVIDPDGNTHVMDGDSEAWWSERYDDALEFCRVHAEGRAESTALFALSWEEEYDDDDNSIYEAASPYHDDGSPFCFRIRQRLRDNKHEFYEDSDAEVMRDGDDPRTWSTLDEAKAALQADANDIVRECSGANDQEEPRE
jgi:hypothetical protein